MNRASKKKSIYAAVIKETGENINVYKLRNPVGDKEWCRIGGPIELSCSQTFTEDEIKLGREVEE